MVDLYQGSSADRGIVRCITPKGKPCAEWDVIDAGDIRFNNYTCMKTEEIAKRQKQILDACKEWK